MASTTALVQRTLVLWVLLPLLLPFVQPLRLCNSWNVNGARFKLRDYPAMAGPIRIGTQGNYSDCLSVTLNFSVSSLSHELDTPINRYFIWLDAFPAFAELSCEEAWTVDLQLFANLSSAAWSEVLNTNQPTRRKYSYEGGWVKCCNSSERCNQVLNPPSFQINATERPITSCNGFNAQGGYRFFTDPQFASSTATVQGQFSDCYSYTIQLTRGTKTLYYVKMDGYDPNLYDGISNCMKWVNTTLKSLKADDVFPLKFNFTMANSWGSCCNTTDCNTVVLPPSSREQLLVPSLLHLAFILCWAFMLLLSLS